MTSKVYDYTEYLKDPAELDIPMGMSLGAIPGLREPQSVAGPPRGTREHESLILPQHPRVDLLPIYQKTGWPNAVSELRVRETVAERVYQAAQRLPENFGLTILDAWRPLELQRELYETFYADPLLPAGYVSLPSNDPTTPPPHQTGGTVDLTLSWKGLPLALGTPFDDFSPKAHADSFERIPGKIRQLRRLLYWVMRSSGFIVINCEWWHFELGTRRWAAITGGKVWYGATKP